MGLHFFGMVGNMVLWRHFYILGLMVVECSNYYHEIFQMKNVSFYYQNDYHVRF